MRMRLPFLLSLALAAVLPAAPASHRADSLEKRGLKIVTRFTAGRAPAFTTTQFIKDERSRIEREVAGHLRVTINQCDEHQVLQLDPQAREYTSYQLNDQGRPVLSRPPTPAQSAQLPEPPGGTLTVNIETTDTGERKPIFGYTARHITERQTMTPGPGAISPDEEIVRDGWYIDLDVTPGCGPRRNAQAFLVGGVAPPGGASRVDKVEFHRKGEPPAGFAVSLTTTTTSHTSSGSSFVSESLNEVVELSTAPLDPSLFDVPQGFQKVIRLPDYVAASSAPTLAEGPLEAVWDGLKRYWGGLFR